MEALTFEQINFVLSSINLWMNIRIDNGFGLPNQADVNHSALLHRLLSGKPPLDKPPPKSYSYPDYPMAEGEAVVIDEISEALYTPDKEYNLRINQGLGWKWECEYRGLLRHKTWGLFNTWTQAEKRKTSLGTFDEVMIRRLQKCKGV